MSNETIKSAASESVVSTQAQHTPGPWRHDTKSNFGNLIVAQSGRSNGPLDDGWRSVATVQDCCASELFDEQEANRRANIALVAAAPDMLAALVGLRHALETVPGLPYQTSELLSSEYERARVAIAKATGGQS